MAKIVTRAEYQDTLIRAVIRVSSFSDGVPSYTATAIRNAELIDLPKSSFAKVQDAVSELTKVGIQPSLWKYTWLELG